MLGGGGCWRLIVHSEATRLVDDLVSVFNGSQNSLHVCVTVLEYFNTSELLVANTCEHSEENSKCYLLSDKLNVKASLKRDNQINFTGTGTTTLHCDLYN